MYHLTHIAICIDSLEALGLTSRVDGGANTASKNPNACSNERDLDYY